MGAGDGWERQLQSEPLRQRPVTPALAPLLLRRTAAIPPAVSSNSAQAAAAALLVRAGDERGGGEAARRELSRGARGIARTGLVLWPRL